MAKQNGKKDQKEKGNAFENEVATLYKLMGYDVQQNVEISGHQIDILLTYTLPGGVAVKTGVECKYVSKGNLKKNDVLSNINTLLNLRYKDKIQKIVIVTTNGFSKEIWYQKEEENIELLTLKQLEFNILDFSNYLQRLINDFEKDKEKIADYYVDLHGEEIIKTPDRKEKRIYYKPIDDYIIKWLRTNNKNHLSILGEYGTGKTTFCRKFARDLATKYFESEDKTVVRIPVLISLKEFSKTMDIESLITNQLVNKCGIKNADFNIFSKLNEYGRFLLIFDGFDEMAQRVDFDITYSNFETIAKLIKPKSKILLTCRIEYFRTHQKETEILETIEREENYDILYLQTLDDEQIESYIKKRLAKKKGTFYNWEYYWDQINEIFDLKDLARRPVLLNFIIKYLPVLVEEKRTINASSLYQQCIDDELKREIKKERAIIRSKDRLNLMKLLANRMCESKELSIHYRKIPEILNLTDQFGVKLAREMEWYLHDFLTCSFLNRDHEGNYHFSHKSFIDFLMSKILLEEIKTDDPNNFGKMIVTNEIMQFLMNNKIKITNLWEWIKISKKDRSQANKYLALNTINYLNLIGVEFEKKDLSTLDLRGANLQRANLRFSNLFNTNLQKANLTSTDLTEVNLEYANLERANLSNSVLINANFQHTNLEGIICEEMNDITSLDWSPDSLYFASGSKDGFLRIWNARDFKIKSKLKGHGDSILCVKWSPNGKLIASGGYDGILHIWDSKKYKLKSRFDTLGKYISQMCWSPDGNKIAFSDSESIFRIWDINKEKIIMEQRDYLRAGVGISYSPNGKHLALSNRIIGIFESDFGKLLKEIGESESSKIYYPIFYIDHGNRIICGYSNCIKIFDVKSKRTIVTFKIDSDEISDLCINSDETMLAVPILNSIKLIDIVSGSEISRLDKHSKSVNCISYSPDNTLLASGANDASISIWNMDNKKCIKKINQRIKCKNLKINGAKGLNNMIFDIDKDTNVTLRDFLISRGAILS